MERIAIQIHVREQNKIDQRVLKIVRDGRRVAQHDYAECQSDQKQPRNGKADSDKQTEQNQSARYDLAKRGLPRQNPSRPPSPIRTERKFGAQMSALISPACLAILQSRKRVKRAARGICRKGKY